MLLTTALGTSGHPVPYIPEPRLPVTSSHAAPSDVITHAEHVVEVFVADVDGAAVHELHHCRQVLVLHVLQIDDRMLARVGREQLLPAKITNNG